MTTNYNEIDILLRKYSFEYLKVNVGPLRLLEALERNNPSMIKNAKKLELLAAAIVYVYLKKNGLNGRGGITAKELGEYFGVKATAITAKVFDVEFWIEGLKKHLSAEEPYEFIDRDRFKVNELYWEFLESPEADDYEEAIKILDYIIRQDPDYFDPYITLHDYYYGYAKPRKAEQILIKGYRRAMKLLLDDGRFPDELAWIHIENRHVIRMLFNFAMSLWSSGQKDEALAIMQQLLRANIGDNIGARYSIVAILEGFESQERFEEKFATASGSGLEAMSLEEWFHEKANDHGKEIGWWLDATDDEEY